MANTTERHPSERAQVVQAARKRSPFAATTPSVVAAIAWAVLGLLCMAFGVPSSGTRWFPLHVFTLGVITNLVLAFSRHFALALTRAPEPSRRVPVLVTNAAIGLVLLGLPLGNRLLVTIGATSLTAVVIVNWFQLRSMRRRALGARFGWIVLIYERAHAAFVLGALLGALLGTQVVTGSWYGPSRLAHLHLNLLGWAGLTVLATLVFFGPSVARARMIDGADDRAARALRTMAAALAFAVVLVVLSALGSPGGVIARVLAGVALGVYATGAAVVCLPVALAALDGRETAGRWSVLAVSAWFPVVAGADALVVATGRWEYLDVVGVAMLVGVLGQAITGALLHVAPMARQPAGEARTRIGDRLAAGAAVRATAFNFGALLLIATAWPAQPGMRGITVLATILIALSLTWPAAIVARG